MKKSFVLCMALLFAESVFAQSGLGDLMKTFNSLDPTKTKIATINVPEGKEAFPYLYAYVEGINNANDPKMISSQAKFLSYNVVDNEYNIFIKYVYKFGKGLQSKEHKVYIMKGEGSELKIAVPEIMTYGIDSNGKHTTTGTDTTQKVKNSFTDQLALSIGTYIKAFSEENYQECFDFAYCNLDTVLNAEKHLQNKLKIKKWYKDHELTGKSFDANVIVSSVDESTVNGFDYELHGIRYDQDLFVVYLTNDENIVDISNGDSISLKGVVKQIEYSPLNNKISRIIIEDIK